MEAQASGRGEGNSTSGRSSQEESCEVQHRRQGSPPIGWKRVRLSASPATGLVGTKENDFLGSFFNCLGFLPLTHERLIRGTMMEVLLPSPSGPEIDNKACPWRVNVVQAENPTNCWGADEDQSGGDPASACALWCTIAMGALVQGQPPEQAAPYMRLAWTSLSQCFDTVTVESGRAFLMMAYLYNFMRDDHKFSRYLEFGRKVVDRLPDQTVQKQEIDELLMMGNDTRIFHTAALEPSELDAFCADESPALEVPDVVRKSDLCRLLLQADRRMMKAFLRDHRAQAAAPLGRGIRHASFGDGTETMPSDNCAGQDEWRGLEMTREGTFLGGRQEGYLSGMSITTEDMSINSTTIDEEAYPSRPGDETWKCSTEARKAFVRLGEAADAPEIRAGVGSLLYNSIMGYLDMVTGSTELEAGFMKVKHCAEIMSRYPGLCRFSTWRHLSHCLLSFLSKLGDVELFEKLRQAYNSVRAEDSPEVPPHAEWTMVGFCDHIFCRSMDHLEKNWGGLNVTNAVTAGEQRWMSKEPHWLHDTRENEDWASLSSESHFATATPGQTFPTHEWTDVMPPGLGERTYSPYQQFQHAAHAQAPGYPAAGPYPMASISQAWSMGGQSPATAPGLHGGTSVYTGAHADGHVHNGWHFSASLAATNMSLAHDGAGTVGPHCVRAGAASSDGVRVSTAQEVFCEKAVYNTAVGGERDLRGTSGSSTST